MFQSVNPKQSFPELEQKISDFWKQHHIFKKSIQNRSTENRYVFYDGPPFITGTPHYGSLLPSIAKDVVPRYQTMLGKRVDRVWGWDCHGLPIENKVEKELKLANRRDIEKYGIQEFVDQCYSYTRHTSAEWKWYIEKIGRWVEFDNSYKTMDQDYMESVIKVFKELYEKDFVYEGRRTSLFCTRCGTPVSNFEIAMDNSYADMEDPAVTIKFKIIDQTNPKFKDAYVLAWTTTPWTLPANRALVVDPKSTYVKFNVVSSNDQNVFSQTDETYIAAKPRLEILLKNVEYKIIEEFEGAELLNLKYQPVFNYFTPAANEHQIYAYLGMVHMNEGTGIVHSAPGFGDIDSEMGKENKLGIADNVDDEGKFTEAVSDYTGIYVKEADPKIIEDLKTTGKLFKVEKITHRYPYCYRCSTPLIHKAQPSWFINIQKLKDELIKNNEEIAWVPEHLKDGRFKKGLETAPDWCISRTRYWATPMPIWQRVENGKVVERVVVGSRDEIREKAVQPISKIVFIRHGEYDQKDEDMQLNKNGLKQAEDLVSRYSHEKFDAVYSSSTQRAVDTVTPLAEQQKLVVEVDETFGSNRDWQEVSKIEAQLLTDNKVDQLNLIAEEKLLLAFETYINKIRDHLYDFLHKHVGQYSLVSTHEERIAFIRHIVEGRSLRECFSLTVGYTDQVTMFFNDTELMDLHRPKIDKITLKGQTGELTRITEVLDVWMDSASMPYASKHYPFENKEQFEQNYPADFIVEYIAQTRAWFYVMHVISSALFKRPAFKNVVTTGVIFGTDGRKMSKSYGNYPDPKGVLEKYGGEALRLYLMGSKIMIGEDVRINEEEIKDQLKTFLIPLWNSYSFFVTYANLHKWKPDKNLVANMRTDNPDTKHISWDHIPFENLTNHLDTWIVGRLQLFIRNVRIALDDYNIPAAVREFPKFLDELSKWYIRRSRDRFVKGEEQALSTLYYVLVEFIKVIAPVAPFVSEAMFQNLVVESIKDQPASIHLADFPHADVKFMEHSEKVIAQMELVRNIVNLAQSMRVKNALKVRQPLSELEVKVNQDPAREIEIENWMKELIKDEVNVKNVDEEHQLIQKTGWIYEKDANGLELNLDTVLTAELQREGIFRELTRQVQSRRKKMGLKLQDKIFLQFATSESDLLVTISERQTELNKVINADKLEILKEIDNESGWEKISINSLTCFIKIAKA